MADTPVHKAMRLLNRLADIGGPVGVKQLSEDLKINVTTTHRILQAMVDENFVVHNADARNYALGADAIRFATRLLGGDSDLNHVSMILRSLSARTQETCAYCQFEPESFTKAITVVEQGPHPLGYDYEVGRRDQIHAGASGKAIMAFLPDEDIARMLDSQSLAAATERTIVDKPALRREIVEIRKRGYATSHGERVQGAGFGIGTPVYGPEGRVIGSVVVTVPLFRWDNAKQDWMSRAVIDAAAQLSALLSRPGSKGATP